MKKSISIVFFSYLTCIANVAFAARSYYRSSTGATDAMGSIGVFCIFLLGIWGMYRYLKWNKQKDAIAQQNAEIQRDVETKVGIVITSFTIGHYENRYNNGSRYKVFCEGPNSFDGWTCRIQFRNCCGKAIKYATFHTRALNRVGDLAPCSVHHTAVNALRYTGPLQNGASTHSVWDAFLYSKVMPTLRIDSVTVEYMDGTKEEIPSDKIVCKNR